MGIGIKELLLILLVVLLVFGTGRLKSLGTDLGQVIKGFRQAVNADESGTGHGSGVSGPKQEKKP